MGPGDHVVGLADAIEALREEFAAAVDRGLEHGSGLRFRVQPVELTMQVVITRKANGRIGWAAVGLGGAVERATTQSLKIRLEPVVELSDGSYTEDFAIAEQHAGRQRFGTRPDAGGGPGRSSPSTA